MLQLIEGLGYRDCNYRNHGSLRIQGLLSAKPIITSGIGQRRRLRWLSYEVGSVRIPPKVLPKRFPARAVLALAGCRRGTVLGLFRRLAKASSMNPNRTRPMGSEMESGAGNQRVITLVPELIKIEIRPITSILMEL